MWLLVCCWPVELCAVSGQGLFSCVGFFSWSLLLKTLRIVGSHGGWHFAGLPIDWRHWMVRGRRLATPDGSSVRPALG